MGEFWLTFESAAVCDACRERSVIDVVAARAATTTSLDFIPKGNGKDQNSLGYDGKEIQLFMGVT